MPHRVTGALLSFCLPLLLVGCGADRASEAARNAGPGEIAVAPVPHSEDGNDASARDDGSRAGEPVAAKESPDDDPRPGSAGDSAGEALDDPSPAPSPEPEPSLIRVTAPGCCTQVSFGADGRSIHYVDQPDPDRPLGIWSVAVPEDETAGLREPRLLTEEIGAYSEDMAFKIEYGGGQTTLVRMADGERWTVPAAGRPVAISPGAENIAWQVSPPNQPYERRTTRVWIAALDGSGARELAALPRGSVSGWLSDQELLVRGRDRLEAEEDVLWALSLEDASLREIARGQRLRGELPSPKGSHIAYYIARQEDPAANGIWIVSSRDGAARKLDDALFGSYRWRDDERLIIVPQEMGVDAHRLVEVDALSLEAEPLTDPDRLSFKIANGDWTVAPDGSSVAFVESADKSIRVIRLP